MKIESIPFNELLGIKPAAAPFILELADSRQLTNHLGTVHASAQLALAEATSGQVLISWFGESADGTLAVVRRVEAKFKAPLHGEHRLRLIELTEEFVEADWCKAGHLGYLSESNGRKR